MNQVYTKRYPIQAQDPQLPSQLPPSFSLHVSPCLPGLHFTTCCINVPWICLSACPSIYDSRLPTSYHCASTKDVSLHGTKSLGIGLNCEPEKLLYVSTSTISTFLPLCMSMCLSGSSPTISFHLNTVYQYYVHHSVLFQGLT